APGGSRGRKAPSKGGAPQPPPLTASTPDAALAGLTSHPPAENESPPAEPLRRRWPTAAVSAGPTNWDSRRAVRPGGSHASAIVSGGWEYDRRASFIASLRL